MRGSFSSGSLKNGISGSHPNGHISSLFKREWVRVCNSILIDRINAMSGDVLSATLGVAGSGAAMKGMTNVECVRRDSCISMDDNEPHQCRELTQFAQSSSNGMTAEPPSVSPAEEASAALNALDVSSISAMTLDAEAFGSLHSEMDALHVGTPSGRYKDHADSYSESLIERHWSPNLKQRELYKLEGRFRFKPFKVMSFNSLARSLVDNKYVHNNREVMSWNSRKFAILDVISQAKADVVCLQEIDQTEYESFFLSEFQRLGYGSVYKKKKSPKLDGVCILYQEDRFDVLFHKEVELSVNDADYDRLQVAIIMALLDKSTQGEGDLERPVKDIYIVANTHLLFNKNRGDVKFAQLCAILSAIKDVENSCIHHLGSDASDHPKPAIIMCGDFNFTPQSLLYHFLSNGYVVLRNCNAKLISGQYLMYDRLYKTEQAAYSKSGITIGDFEGNYISEIYGTGGNGDWVEPLCKTPCVELFTRMPDWIRRDSKMHDVIPHYLGVLNDCGRGEGSAEGSTPIRKVENTLEELSSNTNDLLFCPFNFRSAYSIVNPGSQCSNEPAFTAFHGWQRGCVDYIWYAKDELDVESIYELPDYGDVKARGNLPNKGWPSSDHFSLTCRFVRRAC
ncbi:endonuclease/exonuclease/phosphatase family domain containing protein [Babesia divergens]|uniref:Endonuclease/exonuclease/phosphatase family domain containing protein n=1 Tax=Babesia divergens TaxID=32595 RepID=A0AAD9GKM7_BABDI|nr:endonuclease/exonuclease/phosphatase family domain containing protein [Babesia divergens]